MADSCSDSEEGPKRSVSWLEVESLIDIVINNPTASKGRGIYKTWGFHSQFIKSTKVLMATPQGRLLGYHTPEQASNQQPQDVNFEMTCQLEMSTLK